MTVNTLSNEQTATNPFKKTKEQIRKTFKELNINFEKVDTKIIKLIELWFISSERYNYLKKKKNDEEILKQLYEEAKLAWIDID